MFTSQKPTMEQLCLFLKPAEIQALFPLAKPLFNSFRHERELKTALDASRINWYDESLCNRLDIIVFLYENGCPAYTFLEFIVNSAARSGCLETLQWLHENSNARFTEWAMDWAAQYGHLHVLKWLHANRNEGCTDYALLWAAENGELLTVQWLCNNRKEFASTAANYREHLQRATDAALQRGHIQVVEWLEERLFMTRHQIKNARCQ
jgi:hypothetical protein